MDYLTQAKTFLDRSKDTTDVEERTTHLSAAAEMLVKAIEELEQSRSMNGVSGLSQQEENVLALLQDSGSGPGQPVSVQSLLLVRAPRSSEQQLFAVLKSLELKGLLITDAAETGYELTEAGYLRP